MSQGMEQGKIILCDTDVMLNFTRLIKRTFVLLKE